MKIMLSLGLLMALLIGTASAALFESKTNDAQPTVLYGKYNNTIVPIKVSADGTVGGGLPTSGREVYIDPTDDLGDTVAAIVAAGVPTVLHLAPGTYTECDITISTPVNLSIIGSGWNTIISCVNTVTSTILSITGQDATSFLSFSNFFMDMNLTGVAVATGISINATGGVSLTNEQVHFNNVGAYLYSTDGGSQAFYLVDVGFEAHDNYLTCVGLGTNDNQKCLWTIVGSTIDQNLTSNLSDNVFYSYTGANSSSQAGRAFSVWMNNSNHGVFSYTVNSYNNVALGYQYANSGGERLGCYCVNDDTAGTGTLNCNYYGGVCGGDSRAFRATADNNAPLNVLWQGVEFFGTHYRPDLVQKTGSQTFITEKNTITAYSLENTLSYLPSITGTNSVTLDGRDLISMTGQTGGSNTLTSGTATSGEGADILLTSGLGGSSTATTGAGVAGSGGDWVETAGNGGDQTNALGTTNTGGAGGSFTRISGNGGVANSGSSTDTGGAGGDQFYAAGVGGVGTDVTGRDGVIVIGGTGTTTSQGHVDLILKTKVIAADDTTPDVRYSSHHITSANTGATAITDLDNPTVGKVVCLTGGSATNPSTIADSGNFNLTAAMTLGLDDMICLYVQADNDYIEISRTDN